MMELDEAIKHAEEKAEELENQCALWKRLADERGLTLVSDYEPCKKCAAEHRQLAEWLKELKRVRELPWLKELKMLRDQKRPQGEWILCSERLPSYSERIVLATVVRRDKTWNNDPYHRLVTYSNGKWYPVPQSINLVPSHMATIEQSDGGQAEVIAWMPLPETYKEEGEAE